MLESESECLESYCYYYFYYYFCYYYYYYYYYYCPRPFCVALSLRARGSLCVGEGRVCCASDGVGG